MKQTDRETIREIVEEGFEQFAKIVYEATHDVNHYRATEKLLRAYPKLRQLVEAYDDYTFEPVKRDKSITVAPPKGETRDHDEALQDSIAAAHRRYQRTKARYDEIDEILKLFERDERLPVIRMYYFGEDADGNALPDGPRYTFEAIADALLHNEKTVRKWRTSLVQEMAVLLFGKDAAVSLESRLKDSLN